MQQEEFYFFGDLHVMSEGKSEHYKRLFLFNPVAIFEEDFSKARKTIDKLKEQKISDFSQYFDKYPETIEELKKSIIVTDVNKAALKLYRAKSKKDFFISLDNFLTEDYSYIFKEQLITIAEGGGKFSAELKNRALDGEILNIFISINFPETKEEYKHIPVTIIDIGKRKKAEYILSEAQRIAHIGSWEFDFKTRKSYWSNEVYKIYGLKKSEFDNTYKAFLQHIHPEDRDLVDRAYNESVKTGKPYKIIHRILLKDGTVKYVQESGRTFYDDEGNPARIIGTTLDITDRMNAQKALTDSEERFRSIVQYSPAGIIVTDSSYHIQYLNKRFSEITGYSREKLIGKDFRNQLFKQLDKKSIQEILSRFKGRLKNRGIRGMDIPEYRFTKKNGEKIWIESRVSTYKNSKSEVLTVSQIIDITERKKREDETRKLSAIVEQSPLSIFITDIDGNIEFVNMQFPKQTGYSYIEVKGKTPRIFKSGEYSEIFYKKLWDTITSGKTWYGELHNKRKNRKLFWEKAIISPIFNDDGDITNFASIKEDITKQKILEQRLNRSQKLEILGQFAGGIAHDFNNILTVINGYSTLILDSLDKNSIIRNDIEQIKSASERATALTRQLLVFSKTKIQNQRVLNINREIGNTAKMLKRLIGEDIQLELKLADNLLNIKADPAQVDQVIMNLAVNSRDAMPNGGILTINTYNKKVESDFLMTHPDISPGEYIEIIVKDSGIGMEESITERIFEPFFTTKGKEHGAGLGLSTVYGIVKQNEGYIEVESIKDKGTSFIILLPSVHEAEKD